MGYSYRLTARVLLYAPSHRRDNTYHDLCYTSCGALAGTRNSSMGPPHEGSIWRPTAPWVNALPLSYVPLPQTSKPCNKIICITYLFNHTILIQISKPCNKIICLTYLFNLTILIQTSKPCNKIICVTYLFNLTILIQTSKPCNKIICITKLFNLTILIQTSKLCNKIIYLHMCNPNWNFLMGNPLFVF